jgi:hypothetical protein
VECLTLCGTCDGTTEQWLVTKNVMENNSSPAGEKKREFYFHHKQMMAAFQIKQKTVY